jgi:hypothetical protein
MVCTCETVDSGRLSGTVGAQQAEKLSLLNIKPAVLDGLEASEPFPQPVYL